MNKFYGENLLILSCLVCLFTAGYSKLQDGYDILAAGIAEPDIFNFDYIDTRKYDSRIFTIKGDMELDLYIVYATINADFMIVQADTVTRESRLRISSTRRNEKEDTSEEEFPAMYIKLNATNSEKNFSHSLLHISSNASHQYDVLVVARVYSSNDPIPGGNPHYAVPRPYFNVTYSFLLTTLEIPTAAPLIYTDEEDFCEGNKDICTGHSNITETLALLKYRQDSKFLLAPKYEVYVAYIPEISKEPIDKSYYQWISASSNLSALPDIAIKVYTTELPVSQEYFVVNLTCYGGFIQAVTVKVFYNAHFSAYYTTQPSFGCRTNKVSCAYLHTYVYSVMAIVLATLGISLVIFSVIAPFLVVHIGLYLLFWYLLVIGFTATVDQDPPCSVTIVAGCVALALSGFVYSLIRCYRKVYIFPMRDLDWNDHMIFMIPMRIISFGLLGMALSYYVQVIIPSKFMGVLLTGYIPLTCALITFSISFSNPLWVAAGSIFVGSYVACLGLTLWLPTLSYIITEPVKSLLVPAYDNAAGFPPFIIIDKIMVAIWGVTVVYPILLQAGLGVYFHMKRCVKCKAGLNHSSDTGLCNPFGYLHLSLQRIPNVRENLHQTVTIVPSERSGNTTALSQVYVATGIEPNISDRGIADPGIELLPLPSERSISISLSDGSDNTIVSETISEVHSPHREVRSATDMLRPLYKSSRPATPRMGVTLQRRHSSEAFREVSIQSRYSLPEGLLEGHSPTENVEVAQSASSIVPHDNLHAITISKYSDPSFSHESSESVPEELLNILTPSRFNELVPQSSAGSSTIEIQSSSYQELAMQYPGNIESYFDNKTNPLTLSTEKDDSESFALEVSSHSSQEDLHIVTSFNISGDDPEGILGIITPPRRPGQAQGFPSDGTHDYST